MAAVAQVFLKILALSQQHHKLGAHKVKVVQSESALKEVAIPFCDARSRSRMLPASPAHQEPAFCYTLIFQCIYWYIILTYIHTHHRNVNTPE